MAELNTIQLGDKVVDTVTQFKGTVVAITSWLNGCRRIGIQSTALEKGLPVDIYTADEFQVEVIESKPSHSRTTGTRITVQKTGGSQNDRAAQRRTE